MTSSGRATAALIALILVCTGSLAADTQGGRPLDSIAHLPSPLSIEVSPAGSLPIGDSANYFAAGLSARTLLRYEFPGTHLFISGFGQYAYLPDQASTTLSMGAIQLGAGLEIPISPVFSALLSGGGGYWFGAFNDFSLSSSNPFVAAALELQVRSSSALAFGISVQYGNFLGLYQGLQVGMESSISLGGSGGSVALNNIDIKPAFPLLYRYYDNHPLGTLTITSRLPVPARDISVEVYAKQYMDHPTSTQIPGTLAAGQSRKLPLYALLTDQVLEITQGAQVPVRVRVDYTANGRRYHDTAVRSLAFYGRNAMTWDDTRKAAAYVTPDAPEVLNFAKRVTSYVRAHENRSVNKNLEAAFALHEALDIYGLNYVPSPTVPYSEASKNPQEVDFLQFPRETLKYRSGDCADISILYSALLESVGVNTAFITIPGHIFVAVDTGVKVGHASSALIQKGEYIRHGGDVWVPVEITLRHKGFLAAWELGAKEWNENKRMGKAQFYPLQQAWKAFPPVGLPGPAPTFPSPANETVFTHYDSQVTKWIRGAIAPRAARLQKLIAQTDSPAARNALGILYAKYGDSKKAIAQLKAILAKRQYLPALLNLGNIYFRNGAWKEALDYYQKASAIYPESPHVLLAVARTQLELSHYQAAAEKYTKLKKLDPALADQFAYLGSPSESGKRAADAHQEQQQVIWEGEQS